MANIVWKIDWMKSNPVFDSYQNLVVECQWTCTGTETVEEKTYTAFRSTSVKFSGPASTFTPYQDLTEQQVLEWVWNSGINKEAIENIVKLDISKQINPSVVELPLPWNQ